MQAQAYAGNPDRPTTLPQGQSHDATASPSDRLPPESESDVSPESSQAHADREVPNAPQTKSATSADPNAGPKPGPELAPQRSRDNGRVYTEAP